MDAGSVFLIVAALLAGGVAASVLLRFRAKREEKTARLAYYRRLVQDIRNAEAHFSEQRETLAGLLEMEEVAARSALEDAKFASRGAVTYDLTDLHRVERGEADRIRRLTTELEAADAMIAECQEAAIAGSNMLPQLHDDLMRRVDGISREARDLRRRLTPRAEDYLFVD